MLISTLLLITLNALSAEALPLITLDTDSAPSTTPEIIVSTDEAPAAYKWQSSYISQFTIHSSCNATERHEITEGLRQALEMAGHAKNHILVHGNKSTIYQKYFGQGPTGVPIGWFEKIASGNRAGILFRCDDPDRNCETQDKWAGHWRGSNATSETVICPLSYQTRLPSTAMCARGFTVATGRPANFWGPDLMHRLYHVPLVGEGIVDHYADGYAGVQELASGSNYTWAGHNSATLTYFATEAYAFDLAVPGEGCVGKATAVEEGSHGGDAGPSSSVPASATSAAAAAAAVTSVSPTRIIPGVTSTSAASASEVSPVGSECHTHDDGTLHCV